jgi:DNA repair exonuclease SbcCD nuclease subunit
MSKIAFLGDTHFGVRGDSIKFHKYMEAFYRDIFFPYIDEHQIKLIVQLGDLFDRRKFINFNTLAECKRYFFNKLALRPDIQFVTLLGNHDIFWKESLEVNSTGLILGEYQNIKLIKKPTTMYVEDTKIDLIPWICKENEDEVFKYVDNSKSDLCVGHFEIAGFPMYRGMHAEEGLSHEMFAKYERVLSGHYHTRSKAENIEYIGTPYEMTWQDAGDPKGFSVFDTATRQLDFIQNTFIIHEKITYDDKDKEPVDLKQLDIKEKYVKLVVINKTDLYKFDRFVNQLYEQEPYEVKIIEDLSEFNEGTIDSEINLEDTISILGNYIDSVETEGDKEAIKTFVKGLYMEAINMEVV